MFRTKEHEKINDMFDRFSKIVNDLHALKKTYTDRDLVRKILQSLTSEWRSKADAIYESIGTSNVTIDGLRVGNIKNKCPKSGRNARHFKKQRAYISWGGDSGDESSEQEEDKEANLCLIAQEEDQRSPPTTKTKRYRLLSMGDGKFYSSLFKPWSNIITRHNALYQRWEGIPIAGGLGGSGGWCPTWSCASSVTGLLPEGAILDDPNLRHLRIRASDVNVGGNNEIHDEEGVWQAPLGSDGGAICHVNHDVFCPIDRGAMGDSMNRLEIFVEERSVATVLGAKNPGKDVEKKTLLQRG
ncbi:unnamed protein product [Cuscuta campestris]|uniref:Uncharacterized protein n=1 Tax=Cuscuta campestris TaxID=132261 RepID=A0A484LE67_9ASTE|nr:unnamed protein product [Cuscuta campestris]